MTQNIVRDVITEFDCIITLFTINLTYKPYES
jgi:hypothetical protein